MSERVIGLVFVVLYFACGLYSSAAEAETSTIFLNFGPDPDFPSYQRGDVILPTSPLLEFDAGDLFSDWGEEETELLKSRVTAFVADAYDDFGIVTTRTRPTDGRSFQTIGIDTVLAPSAPGGVAFEIDNDAFDMDFARVWPANFARHFTVFEDNLGDLDLWANAIGHITVHEAGHNYGLEHCDASLTDEERAAGELQRNHFMDGGCITTIEDLLGVFDATFDMSRFSTLSRIKLKRVVGQVEITDINADEMSNVDDLDWLVAALSAGDTWPDLDNDGSLTGLDVDAWLREAATRNGQSEPYRFGDSDLDGFVDASDLNRLALNWQQTDRTWSQGDFTGDGLVDGADLNRLALNWRTANVRSAVPEPGGQRLLVTLFFLNANWWVLGRSRRCEKADANDSNFASSRSGNLSKGTYRC